MKMYTRLFLIVVSTSAVGLFAESTIGIDNNWGNLTALGAVITVLLFITMKMLPDLHQKSVEQSRTALTSLENLGKEFTVAAKEIQCEFVKTLDKIHERNADATKENTQELSRLREHCAAMHGMKIVKSGSD